MLDALQCRTCLRAFGSARQLSRCIFDASKRIGECEVLCADMLLACAALAVNKDDDLPQQICSKCFKKLCASYKFRQLCKESYSTLLQQRAQHVETIKTEIKEDAGNDAQHAHGYSSDNNNFSMDMEDNFLLKEEKEELKLVEKEEELDFFDVPLKPELDEDPDYEIPLKAIAEKKKNVSKTRKVKVRKKIKELLPKPKKKKKKPECEMLKCTQCPRMFNFPYELLRHEDNHIGLKNYYCLLCKKYYRNEVDHKKVHKRGFNYRCEICGKCFNTKAKLSIHTETHSKDREKKFSCDVENCVKSYMSINGLLRHKLIHGDQRNYVCHLCSKRFLDKYQMDVHIKMHTNDKAFACKQCDKKFITSSARTAHEKCHSNLKNYHCKDCDKMFVRSSALNRHRQIHTQDPTLACRFCDKKFSGKENKRNHEIAVHGVMKTTPNILALNLDKDM